MQVSNPILAWVFNNFDAPIRYTYCRLGWFSKLLNRMFFWKLYASNTQSLDKTFEEVADVLAKNDFDIQNKRILEIGPGNSFVTAYNFIMKGADAVILSDKYPRTIKGKRQQRFFNDEIIHIKQKYNLDKIPFIKENALDKSKLQLFAGDFATMPQRIEPVDFICSFSVLEHISNWQDVIVAMSKLVKQGGYMYHRIDLRDHYNFNRPFLFYKYSPQKWQKLTNEGLSYTNRVRFNEFTALFRKAGFVIVEQDVQRFSFTEKKIDKTFYNRNDLDVGIVRLLLKKV